MKIKERKGNKKRQKDSASNCALTELSAHCQPFSILSQDLLQPFALKHCSRGNPSIVVTGQLTE